MQPELEKEIVIRVQKKKDENALSQLYHKYLPLIYGFMLKRVGSKVQAEDLTSQVFLAMVQAIEEFEFRSSFKNWLMGIAKNILRSNWQEHYKMKGVPLDEFLHLTEAEQFVVDEKIEADIDPWEKERQKLPEILKLLPVHYAEVIKCRFLRELNLKQTAKKMGLSVNYVKVLQYRAVRKAAKIASKQEDKKFKIKNKKQIHKNIKTPEVLLPNLKPAELS